MRPLRCVATSILMGLGLCVSAQAAPVTVIDHGHASLRDDPFLPRVAPPYATGHRAPAASVSQASGQTYRSELVRLHDARRLEDTTYELAVQGLDDALTAVSKVSGTRRAELRGAISNLDVIAARGQLTGSRVPPLATILDRNRLFWTSDAPLPAAGDRVTFKGSRVIYQYFRGEGIQFHPLANFGRAGALAKDPRYVTNAESFLDELRGFAVPRPGGGLTWEYSFDFGGGRPPWISGLSQGAAIQAYARSAQDTGREDFAEIAREGLRVYELAPPNGVRVATKAGAHYLIYSFAPRVRVINAFIYALIGLHDVATILGDARAKTLFEAGDAEARLELPRYDTGAWSLYDGVTESDLNYHRLLQGFLTELCQRVPDVVYCKTAARFKAYEKQAPRITLLTRHLKVGRAQKLSLRLSKVSNVTITGRRDGFVVYSWNGRLAHGIRSLAIRPRRTGRITFSLLARDLAGNVGSTSGAVSVP